MTTFNQIITSTRQMLNDTAKDRWSDDDLLEYANEAVRDIRRLRPDLFLGLYTQSTPLYLGTDAAPVPEALEASVKDYVVYRAHARDDEHVVDQKAVAFLGRFRQVVLTI